MRVRLAQLPRYSGEDAVRELQQALVEAENQFWDIEVSDDGGGIAVPMPDTHHPDKIPTAPASRGGSRRRIPATRHPGGVATVPGPGARRAGHRPPTR